MKLSNEEVAQLVLIIRDIVQQEISKIKNLEFTYFGSVSVDNLDGTFDVSVPGTSNVYSKLLNKTNGSLSVGDAVLIRAKDNNMGNAYIAIKCG